MKETVTPPGACFSCGKRIDRTSSALGNYLPRPGDFTLCIKCGYPMAFADDLSLRELTDEERVEAQAMPDLQRVAHAINLANKKFNSGHH